MLDLSALNPAQREATTAPDGPVLVIAGAGSGKTRTIVHRLAWLAEQGVNPASMLLLTFTRKASREMLERATRLLGYSLGGVCGGTFHAFAYSVLRRHRPAWANGPVTVMDGEDGPAALKECREALKIGRGDRAFPKNQALIGLFSKARNKEMKLEELLQRDSPHLLLYGDELVRLQDAYQSYRREHNLLDYDDLLFELEALLVGDPANGREGLARELQQEWRHIMVDEYQDTNRVQARIVRLLAGESGNVMAVGDDAQSIYAFRGADVRNILDFPRLFPAARVIRLEENYRSTPPVLGVANAVLAGAEEGFHKRLFTNRPFESPPPVRLMQPMSDITQAALVAQEVERLLGSHRACEIAVLFRAGYQSYHLEVELTKRNIRFRKYGGLRYAEAAHVRDVLAFVRLAVNPLDLPSFRRVAELSKGVGSRTASKIYEAVRRGGLTELQTVCRRFPDLLADMRFLDEVRQNPPSPGALLERVLEHYQPRLEKAFPEDWPRRKQGLGELAHIASAYTDVEQFVADLSLNTGGDEDPADEENCVVLSTIHSAKGLEWDAVILLDLVEERFPSRHALVRPESFEEERRLMYVACTRAREVLELCVPCSLYNRQIGGNNPARPSPFVSGLPDELEIWREGYGGLQRLDRTASLSRAASHAGRRLRSESDKSDEPDDSLRGWQDSDEPDDSLRGWREASLQQDEDDEADEIAPIFGRTKTLDSAGNASACGYCRHKIFGRGKIVKNLPPDKCQVNFPGLGLKTIMRAYLTMEE